MKNISFLWACLLLSSSMLAQSFSSVQLLPLEQQSGVPIIRLNSSDQLLLSFDELYEDPRDLGYRFVHCNHDGQASTLEPFQYHSAWPNKTIDEIMFSINTYTPYTHYELTFPLKEEQFLVSGLYYIEVFDLYDKDQTLFRKAFWVCEDLLSIQLNIIAPKRVEYRQSMQELQIRVQAAEHFNWQNLNQNLHLVVQQNGRQDDWRSIPMQYMVAKEAVFQDHEGLLFEGGNEYRTADLRTLEFNGYDMERLYMSGDEYHVDLAGFADRSIQTYASDDDANGIFVIKANKKRDSRVESQYVHTRFKLPVNAPVPSHTEVHLLGELNQWQLNQNSLMQYDPEQKAYIGELFLKQGYYNYLFVQKAKGSSPALIAPFEGSHQVSRNDYTVYIYYRGPGDYYDRCVGIKTQSSQ